MRKLRAFVIVAAAASLSSLAFSATIRTLAITRESGRYNLEADTYLAAKPGAIYNVLLDYEHFGRISSVYKEYGYLESDSDGVPIVFTRMEGCVLGRFFCKSLRRVERLESQEPGFIRTTTLPEQSDFKYSVSEWELEPEASGTRVIYRLEMEPDFWVPPLIGPWLLERRLLRGGADAIDRIERLALEAEAEAESSTVGRTGIQANDAR